MALLASNRVTAWPRSAAVQAAARPAGPAPTTATFLRAGAGWMRSRVSWPARGLTRQLATFCWNTWSRQAWLQAMQVLMASRLPMRAFFTQSASARKGRAMLTMSALPSASTCSAVSGMLMRLLVTTGVAMPSRRNASRSFLVTQAKPARGTLVAMVGMRASCQPMPLLIKVAPARETARARVSTSSQLWPCGTRSSRLKR